MGLFLSYLKQRWRIAVAGLLFFLIFMAVFALYRLPALAVLYPTGLCMLLGLVLVVFDFRRVKQRHEILQSLRSLTDVITGTFPKVCGIEDEDYQKLIHLMSEEHIQYQTEANRRYSDMIDYYTVWVHQIKTPIASMRLHLENEDSALARKLRTDLFRVEQYVEMVLMFFRLNSESTDYVIGESDLDTIVKQAVKKFAGEFIERRLTLVYEPLHTTVITDEKWISFVIEQILSNALKYTPSGNITIAMEQEKELCIRDTGIGIASDDLPRIFENGYTGYNGRTDKKASGIGLYLCRRICTNLGHGIKAESVVGEGTVIRIDFRQRELKTE